MKAFIAIIFTVSVVLAENAREKQSHKDKRGISNYGSNPLNLDPFNGLSSYDASLWNPVNIAHPIWDSAITSDLALGRVQLQATHNLALQTLQDHHQGTPSIAYSPEVLRAIQHAKEANHHVHLAQHRVDEAKQAAILQQRIALAKEAAAREAAQISGNSGSRRGRGKGFSQASGRTAATTSHFEGCRCSSTKVAAARETAAAAAIQRSAADTAAELRKQDVDKQITQSEREARARDLVAAKENAISQALHNNAVQKQAPAHHPWS